MLMNRKLLLLTFLTFFYGTLHAQQIRLQQYLDGADTGANAILIDLDTSSSNIWQIGPPQKTIFDSAATSPNVLVTDTINYYPKNNTSTFSFKVSTKNIFYIVAIRWKQKLDMDSAADGGIVELSVDTGKTWQNVFNNSNVYNFYGYNLVNADTFADGTPVFTGKDTAWRDIWLCFSRTYLSSNNLDSLIFKFTFKSDSSDNQGEGWMIDNILVQETYYHTVSTVDPDKTFLVYPTITSGVVNVAVEKDVEKIQQILVVDPQGRVIRKYNTETQKTTINIGDLPKGNYYLNIYTQDKIEAHKILLSP